jgi:TonB family protein
LSRWLLLIVLVLAAHVVLIFAFGARKPITPRAVTNAPELKLATGSSEWLILNDPTLFALPSREGFAGPMLRDQQIGQFHRQEWTEPPRWLPLPAGELGGIFSQFMQTNRFATFQFEFKPPPRFTIPLVPLEPKLAGTSTFRVEGDLARRQLLTPMALPSWPYTDVLAPSKVQVLVNAAGDVVSVVLLSPSGFGAADQRALELARAARFAPAPDLTIGKLIFDWYTVTPPATNAPAGS